MFNLLLVILIFTAMYSLLAIGQNLITGYVGLLSLCQASFFAIGSYTTAILTTAYGYSFWVTLPIGGILAALSGILVGLPTLRLKGDYLAIATLGFGEIVKNILTNWDSLTNGPLGIQNIPMISIFGHKISPYSKLSFLSIMIITVVIFYFLYEHLVRTRLGRAFEAIREDEIAASSLGINVTLYKVVAFALGAFIAGIAGSFHATYILSVVPNSYNFMVSILILCMVVLGGMGNFKATILAAFLLQLVSELPRLLRLTSIIPPQFNQILFGLILVLLMIYRPQGILGRPRKKYETKKDYVNKIVQKDSQFVKNAIKANEREADNASRD